MKPFLIVLSLLISGLLVYYAISPNDVSSKSVKSESKTTNITIEDEKQIVSIISTAGGYSPSKTVAQANMPTILRMNSQNSYGCERSFRIPKMNINEILPTEGTTDIDLGTPEKGEEIFGSCSMGMYTFTISFE